MIGVEIDFVVTDSLKALHLYQQIFDIEVVESTNFPRGTNEAVFTLHGTRFHLLDENPEFQLVAPKAENPTSVWFNVTVPNIQETFDKAVQAGSKILQEPTEMIDFGITNAMFTDEFGYTWMLHQIHKIVSLEDRVKLFEQEDPEF
ncbi:VOC family protein [Listeria grandensis]|uniref:VOC family protein n=1 Tax=Listeria grandensis TaxID=1494963 RepID=A0A7X1CNK1_9LIST|nr:VOC family protein [Listeria grandensis]MBC1934972.1 VOC family protein [Listeria grandensis]